MLCWLKRAMAASYRGAAEDAAEDMSMSLAGIRAARRPEPKDKQRIQSSLSVLQLLWLQGG